MRSILVIAVAVFGFAGGVYSQVEPKPVPAAPFVEFPSDEFTAPVVWERYKVSNADVSIVFPKLPVVDRLYDPCAQVDSDSYFAYAEDTAYETRIASRSKNPIPTECREKFGFGRVAFDNRLSEIRRQRQTKWTESKSEIFQRKVIILKSERQTRWVIDDLKNNKWIELAVHHRPGAAVDEDRFLNTLSFSSENGKEIWNGSPRTLGDRVAIAEPVADGGSQTETVTVIATPRSPYTEAARRAGVQGRLRLKVTFLAQGGIGDITAVTTLSHGLTEQALAAAKRLVFLPARRNGTPVTVVKSVEYGFNLY